MNLETPFQNILVPIDESPQSRNAREMAIFMSKLFHSHVTFMHVVSDELPALAGALYSPREDYVPINPATYQFPRTIELPRPKDNVFPDEVLKEITQRLRENGETLLTESASLFAAEDMPVKQKLVEARDVATAILDEAATGTYDLIIMGSSGGDETEADLHLGSVAKKVSLSVKTPVMVVRRKGEARKILIPVEGSQEEEKTLQQTLAIAKAAKSDILLLHVQEKALLRLRPEIKEIGVQILNRASKTLEGVQSESKVVAGDPAKVIIETAEKNNVDLVIMRAGGHDILTRVFLGSVSDHVLHHATTTVLLTK
jgi:nucleotide-binding universal stress UspA family protein